MAQRGEQIPERMPNPEIATLHEDDEGDVTLTLKKGKFAEFLFGFLGAKETLSKTFRHDFTVKMEDLLQFHYLLTQKIAKEQFISMVLETATIQYDDETNRTINTFQSIEKYSEHRDVGVLSFSMSWNFVFKTPNQNDIQQQKVSVFFETVGAYSRTGNITVKIEHTNQVWAAEVLRLFEEHISKIAISYTFVYRALRFIKRFGVVDAIAAACIFFILGGGIYIMIQRRDLLEPLKVRDEFIFDIANVLIQNKNDRDVGLLLQFFLLRDLRSEPRAIVAELQKEGHFNPKYKEVIDKWVSGYYDSEKKSEKVYYGVRSLVKEIQAMQNIHWAYSYLKFALLYLVGYVFVTLYLKIFRMQSILALTSKGIKQMEKQEKAKSILVQFMFGIMASLIATIIYECTGRLLLIK
jgi:hypothetical protein